MFIGQTIRHFFRFCYPIKKQREINQQEKQLKQLLKKAAKTQFGKKHSFLETIQSSNIYQTYQKNTPIHDYESMNKERRIKQRNGEKNITRPGKIEHYALSSGTSGAPSKYIPVSQETIKQGIKAGYYLTSLMTNYTLDPRTFTKQIFLLAGSSSLEKKEHYFCGDMSGIQIKNASRFVDIIKKPSRKISEIKDREKRLDKIAQDAPQWDISIICGIPSRVQLLIEKIIEKNNASSIFDIRPNLKLYVHGGIAFPPYKNICDNLFHNKVQYLETYMASEGIFAFQTSAEKKTFQFLTNNGIFFEFLPFIKENFDKSGNVHPNAKAYSLEKIEENKEYALIISTCSGAWRYLIGDTLKFIQKETKEFILTGRTKQFLSICGEHLSVDNMTQALQKTAQELKIDLNEFTVQSICQNNKFSHKRYIGSSHKQNNTLIKKHLDKNLQLVNDDYKTERENMLQDIIIETIPNDFFFKRLKQKGKNGSQSKIARVMKPEKFKEREKFVMNQSSSRNTTNN